MTNLERAQQWRSVMRLMHWDMLGCILAMVLYIDGILPFVLFRPILLFSPIPAIIMLCSMVLFLYYWSKAQRE